MTKRRTFYRIRSVPRHVIGFVGVFVEGTWPSNPPLLYGLGTGNNATKLHGMAECRVVRIARNKPTGRPRKRWNEEEEKDNNTVQSEQSKFLQGGQYMYSERRNGIKVHC